MPGTYAVLNHSLSTPHLPCLVPSLPRAPPQYRNLGSPHFRHQGQGARRFAWRVSPLTSPFKGSDGTVRLQALRLLLGGHRTTLWSGDLARSPCAAPLLRLPEGEPRTGRDTVILDYVFNRIKPSAVHIWDLHKYHLTDCTITSPRQIDAALLGILHGILPLTQSFT